MGVSTVVNGFSCRNDLKCCVAQAAFAAAAAATAANFYDSSGPLHLEGGEKKHVPSAFLRII